MNKIKALFSTRKRAVASVICIVFLLTAIGTGTVFAAGAVAESTSIGEDAANRIAFADAGVLPENAAVKKTEFDFERGRFVYEIEFYANGTEYEYTVNAEDGTVIKKETEKSDIPLFNLGTSIITLDKAKEIAAADAGFNLSDVTFTQAEFEEDDGRHLYELEFVKDGTEYEYKINAQSGGVLKKNVKASSPVTSDPDDALLITLDRAKELALEHAGVNGAEAVFKKAETDRDDGRYVYELEFYVGNTEYEYDIDGINGSILDWEKDTDD